MTTTARWYDPGIMAFASADTLIPDPSNPLGWNRYLYSRANPINRDDPTGHAQRCPDDTCGSGGSTMEQLRQAREQAKLKESSKQRVLTSNNGPRKVYPWDEGYWDLWYNDYLPMIPEYYNQDVDTLLNFTETTLLPVVDIIQGYTGIKVVDNRLGFGLDFVVQVGKDRNKEIAPTIKLNRALAVGGEGMATSYLGVSAANAAAVASIGPATSAAVRTGNIHVAPAIIGGTWVATYMVINTAMTTGFDALNSSLFPRIGWGDYP